MAKIMKKTYLLLLTIIMAAGFLIAAGVVTAQTAYADTDGYNLWVGDSQVTSNHRSGAGWSFDPGSNTLTLNGFTYSGSGHVGGRTEFPKCGCIFYGGEGPFNLMIEGNNSITNTNQEVDYAYGIYCASDLTINGTGTLITSSTEAYGGMGINCIETVKINNDTSSASCTISATGRQYGINGQEGVVISGGIVEAKGASPNDSYGINGTDGKLLTIGENVQSVVISGLGANAVAVYGLLVKNDVEGIGWNNTAGTGDAAAIPINKDGAELNYKKMVFEPKLDISITGNSSTVTYNAKEQSVSGYTVKYNVGDDKWTDEAPAGVSVKLKDDFTAEAKGTDVKTYKMGLTADSFDISWGYAGSGNLTVTDGALTVEKAPLTITANDQTLTYNGQIQGPGDTVYEDAAQIAELVSTVGLQGTDALSSIIVDGQRTEIGEYPITLFGAAVGNATENYAITYVDGTLKITPIPLKVTINGSSAKKVYNGKQQTYTGTVTVKSSDPAFDASKFSYKGSKDVTGTDAGVYTTNLATESCVYNDPQYELNVSIGEPVKLTIESASLTATVNGGSTEKVYNGKEQTYEGVVKATSSDKAFDPSKFSYKGSKDVTGTDVGVYTTELNGKDCAYSDTNYEVSWTVGEPVKLTITRADITPSVSIQGWSYGSDANKPKVEGNTGGGTEKFLYKEKDAPDTAYTEKVPTDAGTYTVKAEVAESDNYNSGSATLDFTIAPGDMQVTSSGADVDFDGSGHSITVNAPEGASVEYSQDGGKTYSTENPVYTDAGKYSVPFRVILKNYNEYEGTEQVIIRQAPNSVSVSIEGWTYGEPAHIPAVDAKFGADHASLSYSDAPDGTYKTGGPDQAGTWYVKATVPETQDYAGAESVPVAFEIAKAKLTITAKDQVFEYNRQEQGEGKEGDSAYSDSDVIAEKVTVEGLQNNDAITSVTLTGHRKTIGEYQDEIKIAGFAINNDDAAKDNYDVTLKSGKLTITKHILTETKEVPATCEKDGTKAYWTCSECKKMFSDKDGENEITEPEVIKATGHDWGEWTVTKEATETEEGEEQRVCKNDPEHKETRAIPVIPASVTYSNVSGEGNIWYKGSDATSDFSFKRSVDDTSTISHFTGIRVDNNAVDEANYSKESGSVIIKLKPEYLETLALGKHTLEARFDDGNGSATAEFTIAEAEEENTDDKDDNGGGSKGSKKNVNTGDESLVALWASLLGVSLIGLVMLFAARHRLRRKD